ncbi:hypothetical protein [Barrientosiimonas endolithica]|uniref:hypothetical protein n=1 Tax=Barrientosiimonas endolithica TaxID=1535208 RepID=UPI00259BC219|nr:hypothetical protein [Barrientosiimonas endolithica]
MLAREVVVRLHLADRHVAGGGLLGVALTLDQPERPTAERGHHEQCRHHADDRALVRAAALLALHLGEPVLGARPGGDHLVVALVVARGGAVVVSHEGP